MDSPQVPPADDNLNSIPPVNTDSPLSSSYETGPVPALPTAMEPKEQPSNKKKIGMKKLLIGFSVFFLLVGTISTVLLVRYNQDIREKASSGADCDHSPDCDLVGSGQNSGSYTATRTIIYVDITDQNSTRYYPGHTNDGCHDVTITGNQVTWNKIGPGPDCKTVSNVQVWMGSGTTTPTPLPTNTPSNTPTITPTFPPGTHTPTPQPTHTVTPTLPPGVAAACGDVQAYDTNWNLLSSAQLAQLKSGDTVRFAVAGTTNSGTFDKARFTINGILQPETSTKKPASDSFYMEYTVPTGTLNFTVTAQVHHSTLGWL